MRTLGNIIWNIPFLGFVTAALVFLIGLLFVVTIIAAPIGLGLIQYSKFLLLPFSYDMVSKSEIDGDANKNILWQTYGFILKTVYVIFLGIPMVILSLVQIVCCFCSIIGIPVAIVMAKSLGTLLQPVGKVCVDHSVAQALLVVFTELPLIIISGSCIQLAINTSQRLLQPRLRSLQRTG